MLRSFPPFSALLLLCCVSRVAALSNKAIGAEYPSELLNSAAQMGICVDLGCGDASLATMLAVKGNLVIHALESDEALVKAARQKLQQRNLYGQVTVERLYSATLPYADNLINILIAEKPGDGSVPGGVSESEIMRVLAPNGVAWFKRDGNWTAV